MSSEHEWRQWLLGYARRWCRCDDDAHDLVQETLIAFFVKHREHLPWEWSDSIEAQRHALRLLRDKYAEYCRRQRRAFSYEELVATVPDPAQSEQALYEQLHDAQLLAQIATRLSPRQQTVLNLLREGYEQHEIAEQMHISLGAVKRYLHLIRRKAAELGASDATFHPPTSGINNGIPQIGGWRDETMDEWSYGANDDCSSSAATGGGGRFSPALLVSVISMATIAGLSFSQEADCTLIMVPEAWSDWKVESVAGATDDGRVAGTLTYTGNDTNIRVRKRIFLWNKATESMTVIDPPTNDNEANLMNGVEACDLSVDGSAISGRITYQGRPSAAFVFRVGSGYRILKQRQTARQMTVGLALSGAAVGYRGYHLAVQPQNDSAFVVPDPFHGSQSLNARCGWILPERIPVRVQRCTWMPLQSEQGVITEPDPIDIDDTLEFQWIAEDGAISSFSLRGGDLFGPGWIPPWSGGGNQTVRGDVRFNVLDISPDGSMIVGSMQVLRAGCYITASGHLFQLSSGEYVMKAERQLAWLPDYNGYAYLAEFKPFFEDQPIRGRATCMAGSNWGEQNWGNPMCEADPCDIVAGVIYPQNNRPGRAFTWYGWGTGDNDADHWTFFANGHASEIDPVQVNKVSGVSPDDSLLLLGRRQTVSQRGFTGYLFNLDWSDLWEPLPAPSQCVDTYAMSPSGRFVAVKYEDGQCLSGAAVIDLRMQMWQSSNPDELKVVFRNLSRPSEQGASFPYKGDLLEVRLFVRYGNFWFTRDCPSISELLGSRWFENGCVPASDTPGEFFRLTPSVEQYEKVWQPQSVFIVGNRRDLNLFVSWYSGHHSVDLETRLTPLISQPCTIRTGNRERVVGWKRFFFYPESRLEAFGRYALLVRAGRYDTWYHPDNDYDFSSLLYCMSEPCVPGTIRIHARAHNLYPQGDPNRRIFFSGAPTPGRYRPSNEDNNRTDESLWSQNCDEPYELALRISVRDITGHAFVDWASAFLNVPYEYGGQGFGARADDQFDVSVSRDYPNNSCDATHRGIENYGIDCSGLVVAAYNLAGITTPDLTARAIIRSPLFMPVELQNLQIGDVLASTGHTGHVVIVYDIHQVSEGRVRVTILDAAGSPAHRVRLLRCTLIGEDDEDEVNILLSDDEYLSTSKFYIRRRR